MSNLIAVASSTGEAHLREAVAIVRAGAAHAA